MSKSEKTRKAAVVVADPGELRKAAAQSSPQLRLQLRKNAGSLKSIHGVCNYAPIQNNAMFDQTVALREMMRDLRIPYCLFHDSPFENPGLDLIDVSRIFPIFTADPDDPANYRFAETDAYLRQVIEDGAKVIYRLGETIEAGRLKFRVVPPADYEKWADICIHIVRHYNEGWANGFRWNITDWAVWEEPNNPNLWGGPFDEYLKLYAVTARKFKARFPRLNIGGPETTTLGIKFLERFLDFCRDEKLPLDFVNYTSYFFTPSEFLSETHVRRRMLDERGFGKIPLYTCEWHPSPVWDKFSDPAGYRAEAARISGHDGAAFATAILCGLHDTPIERACLYSTAMPGGYGIFDSNHRPTPVYYVLERYCRLFNRSQRRVKVEISDGYPDFQVVASEFECGVELLMGAYSPRRHEVAIEIPAHFELASAEILDADHPRFTAVDAYRMRLEGRTLTLLKADCPTAFHVELRRK